MMELAKLVSAGLLEVSSVLLKLVAAGGIILAGYFSIMFVFGVLSGLSHWVMTAIGQ